MSGGQEATFQTIYYGAACSSNVDGHLDDNMVGATSVENLTSSKNIYEENDFQETKGQIAWSKKCISQFSLYADLVGDTRVSDPFDQLEAIESGDFKPKQSKSAKKRLRRLRKKHVVSELFRAKAVQMKRISKAVATKRAKKDLKKVINQLSNLPL